MKYVFVDMDGVIAEYGYPSGLYSGEFQKGNYTGKRPVKTVIEEILKTFKSPEYVLMICSASPNAQGTLEKNAWLDTYFRVPYENRIFIGLEEDKVDVITYYIESLTHTNVQEYAIIIDDKGKVLSKAQSLGIECYHPTQLLAISDAREEEKNRVEKMKELFENSEGNDDNDDEKIPSV